MACNGYNGHVLMWQGVVIMMEALAEVDSCSADARCLESLLFTAEEFSTRLAQGQPFQPSDLCRVRHVLCTYLE